MAGLDALIDQHHGDAGFLGLFQHLDAGVGIHGVDQQAVHALVDQVFDLADLGGHGGLALGDDADEGIAVGLDGRLDGVVQAELEGVVVMVLVLYPMVRPSAQAKDAVSTSIRASRVASSFFMCAFPPFSNNWVKPV